MLRAQAFIPIILFVEMLAGGRQTAQAQTNSSPTIRIETSADGKSAHQGEVITIVWQTTGAPPGSAVALWPEKALTGHLFAPIAVALPGNGSYTWRIPIFVPKPIPCAPDRTGGCIGTMNPNTTYKIVARLYTPDDADLVEFGPTKKYPAWAASAESATFEMLAVH